MRISDRGAQEPEEGGVSRPRRPAFLTVDDLLAEAAETPWLVQGLIPAGALTLFYAPPEEGKSTMLIALLASIERGEPFCGLSVAKTRSVMMTEEPRAALAEKARRFGLSQMLTLTRSAAHGLSWGETILVATEQAQEVGADLLIVDSFGGWVGFEGDMENSSGATLKALRTLRIAVDSGLTVVLVHHSNKGGGHGAKRIRGSSAILQEVDARVEMQAQTGGLNRRRILRAHGRYEDHIPQLRVVLEHDRFELCEEQGTPPATPSVHGGARRRDSLAQREQKLLNAIRQTGGKGMTRKAALKVLSCRTQNATRLIDDLVGREQIRREGNGTPGSPYRLFPVPS